MQNYCEKNISKYVSQSGSNSCKLHKPLKQY
jgi:hypothetical protein